MKEKYDLAGKVIGFAMRVHRELGAGFNEQVYKLILELKAVQNLVSGHEVQLVNYLTATRINTGLLLNFGADSLQFKRKFRQQAQACDPEPPTLQS